MNKTDAYKFLKQVFKSSNHIAAGLLSLSNCCGKFVGIYVSSGFLMCFQKKDMPMWIDKINLYSKNRFFRTYVGVVMLAVVTVVYSCSPKVTKPVVNVPVKPVEQKVEPKFTQGNISVFIPFQLNQYNLKTINKSQIGKADMPLDFYQGLMLGINEYAAC